MDSKRQNFYRRQRVRDPLDRRLDKWIETGKQFVDGVAGTRPGKRRSFQQERRGPSRLENVGRWMGDKLDWILEDEDGWLEPWESEISSISKTAKRPLDAISRRVPNNLLKEEAQIDKGLPAQDEWPQESSFRVDRWQRSESVKDVEKQNPSEMQAKKLPSNQRPLPRSSRRRA